MAPAADNKTVLRYAPGEAEFVKRRKRVARTLALLGVATIGLILFILVMGDVRRYNFAVTQAETYIGQVSQRVGQQHLLPLNLTFQTKEGIGEPGMTPRRIEWLTRDEAWLLRGSDQRVMVSWTGPIRRRLMTDGRIVVFFDDGTFSFDWMSLDAFLQIQTEQLEEIERLQRKVVATEAQVAEPQGPP